MKINKKQIRQDNFNQKKKKQETRQKSISIFLSIVAFLAFFILVNSISFPEIDRATSYNNLLRTIDNYSEEYDPLDDEDNLTRDSMVKYYKIKNHLQKNQDIFIYEIEHAKIYSQEEASQFLYKYKNELTSQQINNYDWDLKYPVIVVLSFVRNNHGTIPLLKVFENDSEPTRISMLGIKEDIF